MINVPRTAHLSRKPRSLRTFLIFKFPPIKIHFVSLTNVCIHTHYPDYYALRILNIQNTSSILVNVKCHQGKTDIPVRKQTKPPSIAQMYL